MNRSYTGLFLRIIEFIYLNILKILDERICFLNNLGSQILSKSSGKTPLNGVGTLCVFASFDLKSVVDLYVLNYLKEIKSLGADLVFVSTSETLSANDMTKLSEFAQIIIHRKNRTLDFGSWKVGLDSLPDYKKYDRIIFANDSVYGPIKPLTEVVDKMSSQNLDMWGMTENFEMVSHLQSYFLVFESAAIRSEFFQRFWREFKFFFTKERVISCYEIGISLSAAAAGLKLGSLVKYRDVVRKILENDHWFYLRDRVKKTKAKEMNFGDLALSVAVNPTIYFWQILLEEFSFPFLKVEILMKNRVRAASVKNWKTSVAKANANFSTTQIEQHVERLGGRLSRREMEKTALLEGVNAQR